MTTLLAMATHRALQAKRLARLSRYYLRLRARNFVMHPQLAKRYNRLSNRTYRKSVRYTHWAVHHMGNALAITARNKG